jgi:murein DD-endopeptidase MepM/ murein hydrolase activator NlpD
MAGVTSKFGYRKDPVSGSPSQFHSGVDYKAPEGTPLVTNKPMTVVDSRYSPSYGNVVTTRDADGNTYTMAHLSERSVEKGQSIPAGTTMGYTGNTGKSTGSHLHYEVTDIRGKKIDPQSIDPKTGKPFTDSVGFEKGKGLDASNAIPTKDHKCQGNDEHTNKPLPQKEPTAKNQPAAKSKPGDKSRLPTRPKTSDVGILENPLNKL